MRYPELSPIPIMELNFHELGLAAGCAKHQFLTVFEMLGSVLSVLVALSLNYSLYVEA